MAIKTIYICDICGREYKNEKMVKDKGNDVRYDQRAFSKTDDGYELYLNKWTEIYDRPMPFSTDLCKDCYDGLKEFIMNRKKCKRRKTGRRNNT